MLSAHLATYKSSRRSTCREFTGLVLLIFAVYFNDFWNVDVMGMLSFRKDRLFGARIKAFRVIIDFNCEFEDRPLDPNCLMGMKADLGLARALGWAWIVKGSAG